MAIAPGFEGDTVIYVAVGGCLLVLTLLLVVVGVCVFCRPPPDPDDPPGRPSDPEQGGADALELGGMHTAGIKVNQLYEEHTKPNGPRPPWEVDGTEPPPLLMSKHTPGVFQSRTIPAASPTLRLLLVSSRVKDPLLAATAALPTTAVVCYDWKNWTLQELFSNACQAAGAAPRGRLLSIGILAPASKPGVVGLLEGCHTTPARLAQPDIARFWTSLAGLLDPADGERGHRIDLLNCRVTEEPTRGGTLLRALHDLTGTPFAASDDMAGGYPLSRDIDRPGDDGVATVSLAPVGLHVLPYYLDESMLFKHVRAQMRESPQSRSLAHLAFVDEASPSTSAAPAPPVGAYIFHRLNDALRESGRTPQDVFGEFDDTGAGLTLKGVAQLAASLVPDVGPSDVAHVQVMVDMDRDNRVTLDEFKRGVGLALEYWEDVHAGVDQFNVCGRLYDYFRRNEALLEEVFQSLGRIKESARGDALDAHGVRALVTQIPGLEDDDIKYALVNLHVATGSDRLLTMDEFVRCLRP